VAIGDRGTVLVTGHDGYIGAVLVKRLSARGHRVRGLDTGYFRDVALSETMPPDELLVKDIREVVEDDVAGVQAIVHLAALSNDAMGQLDPPLTLDINFSASVRLAQLAKRAGVERFLASSSCSMYGVNSGSTVTEDAPLHPQTTYALSKVKMEEAILGLADDSFSPTFLRNGTAYGLSPKLRLDLVLNNMVAWAIATGEIRVMSDGTPWRPLVHVEDICDAFIAVLEASRERVHGQALNIGHNGGNYQVRDIAEGIRRVVPGCRVVYAGSCNPDRRSYQVDFSKVRCILPELEHRWDIERGARQIFEALEGTRLVPADVEGRRFVRLTQLQHLIARGDLNPDLTWSRSPSSVGPIGQERHQR
jgi:nucleoside-diphosphate-sugar epimerase